MIDNNQKSPYKLAVVTGASKGIGKELVKVLVCDGYSVIGTSRNPNKIDEKDKIHGVIYKELELTDSESIINLVKVIKNRGTVEILVNSAGSSQIGPVEEIPIEKIRKYFNINVFGMMQLTRRIIPMMRENGKGFILNIGSMAGRSPVPFSAHYAATKAAVEAFSKGLRYELREFGIKVVAVAPFEVNTTIPQEMVLDRDSLYFNNLKHVKKIRDFNLSKAPQPEYIAEKIFKILNMKNPKPFYAVGKNASIKSFLVKHLPSKFIEKTIRKMYLKINLKNNKIPKKKNQKTK